MINDHRVCALIPARGGSKGIPRKNLYELQGISLVERSVILAKRCKYVDRVFVSTEDSEITALAVSLNASTPEPRPSEFATDGARTIEIIKDLVNKNLLDANDCILLLQPTTPLRTMIDLEIACECLFTRWDEIDAVVGVSVADGMNPYKAQMIEGGVLTPLIIGQDSTVPRQSLPTVYFPNGAFYLAKVDILLKEDTFLPKKTYPIVMSTISSINLDGPLDLLLLEAVVDKGLATQALNDSGK